MTLVWSFGPHSITLSDQLIRCWTAGMVALTVCSLSLLLPLSSGSLVNIIYTPSWRGNCSLHLVVGDLGVGWWWGPTFPPFPLANCSVKSHCQVVWLAGLPIPL